MPCAPLDSPLVVRDGPVVVEPERTWWLPVTAAVLSAAAFMLVRPHLIDDAYVTLSYARNLALHGHWGLIEQGTANTATSPLNVLALAALTLVLRDAVLAAGVLFVACQVLLLLALRRLGNRVGLPPWFAPTALLLLTLNPLLISSVGLEVLPGAAGLGWLVVFATERRPVASGVVAGVLALIRLDLLVLAAVVLVARKRCWEGEGRTVATVLAVALPWFLFSWFALGSAVPDTMVLSTLRRSWSGWSFPDGAMLYLRSYPLATVLSFLPVLAGGLAGLLWAFLAVRGSVAARKLAPFATLGAGGAAHLAVYSCLTVPPNHWYFGPGILAATVFVVAVIAALAPPLRFPAVTGVTVLTVVSTLAYVGPGLPREFAPITSNRAGSDRYQQIGVDLARIAQGRTVRGTGEIGALAYYCDCAIVDLASDRGAVRPAIEESERRSGWLGRALTQANFCFFDFGVAPARSQLVLETTVDTPPPTALAQWTMESPWSGTQQLYLVTAADAHAATPAW